MFHHFLHNPYNNSYHKIDNPPTPYNGDIPNSLDNGKQIFIAGTFNPNADSAAIDLINNSNGIALHINPRFKENVIVRNSKLGGWGPEERSGAFAFKRGQAFELVILVEEDKFKVSINGQHSFDFKHRTGYREINRINIGGDVRLSQIVFSGGANSRPNEVISPALPVAIPVFNGLIPGRMVQIHGQVPLTATSFAINFQNGTAAVPNDIAFHFNPRFNESCVVKNNRRHSAWGAEQRDSSNPFQRGRNFEVLVLCEPTEFKVAVNGVHFTSFQHRNKLHDGSTLGINGDVTINSIRQF